MNGSDAGSVRRRWLTPVGIGLLPLACVLGVIVLVGIATLTWNTSPYYGRNDAQPPTVNVGTVPSTQQPLSLGSVNSGPATSWWRLGASSSPSCRRRLPSSTSAPRPTVSSTSRSTPKVVGWWSPGRRPGSPVGTAILAGHINYAGVTGTLSDIGELKPGNTVRIYGINAGHQAEVTFRVAGVRTYHKTSLPYQKIFDQNGTGRIAIVTCGGPFDASTGNYLDNIVVYAVPVFSD